MVKRTILVITILVTMMVGYAQTITHIYPSPKALTELTVADFGKHGKIKYFSTSEDVYGFVYEFNTLGYLTATTLLRGGVEGRYGGGKKYVYDKQARLIRVIEVGELDAVEETTRYTYDKDNYLMESITTDGSGKDIASSLYNYQDSLYSVKMVSAYSLVSTKETTIAFHFNSQGQLEKELIYDESGKVVSCKAYTYNQSGRISIEMIGDNGSKYNRRSIHSYDKQGNETQILSTNPDNTITLVKNVMTYNANNDLLTKKTYDGSGNLTESVRMAYSYDSTGNYTKKMEYLEDELQSDEMLQFTYY